MVTMTTPKPSCRGWSQCSGKCDGVVIPPLDEEEDEDEDEDEDEEDDEEDDKEETEER